MTANEIYDYIIENGIATEKETRLVTCINGFNEEALNDIVFARTGYRDIEQTEDSES